MSLTVSAKANLEWEILADAQVRFSFIAPDVSYDLIRQLVEAEYRELDVSLLTQPTNLRIMWGVPESLKDIREGFGNFLRRENPGMTRRQAAAMAKEEFKEVPVPEIRQYSMQEMLTAIGGTVGTGTRH